MTALLPYAILIGNLEGVGDTLFQRHIMPLMESSIQTSPCVPRAYLLVG